MKKTKDELALFSKVMWGLAEEFGGKISDDNLEMRFIALQEYSVEQISAAGTWLLKNRENTFPAVPTTKEIIDAINLADGPSSKVKAEIEVDKVLETLREFGRDAEPLFYDKITVYLMTKRWTFRKLDLMAIDDPGFVWFRKEFVQAYLDIEKDRADGRNVLPELCSDVERNLMEVADDAIKRIPSS